jgi:ribosome production factor 2
LALVVILLPLTSISTYPAPASAPHRTFAGAGTARVWEDGKGSVDAERVAVFLRGASTSEKVIKVLTDLHAIKKPYAVNLPTRVEGGQMQGNEFVERTCEKMRASMYGFVSSTQKRPDRLILGRLFSGKVLDSFEFRVLAAGPALSALRRLPQLSSMTAFVFLGKYWQSDRYLTQFKNFLIDTFGIRHSKILLLDRVETVLVSTAHNQTHVTLKQYLITTSDDIAAGKIKGKMELRESLPDVALELVHGNLCDADRMREALGLDTKAKTPHSLKQLQRKHEKKLKVQGKRTEKVGCLFALRARLSATVLSQRIHANARAHTHTPTLHSHPSHRQSHASNATARTPTH